MSSKYTDFTYLYSPYSNLLTSRKIYKEMVYESPRVYTNLSRYKNTDRIFDKPNDVYYDATPNDVTIPETFDDTYITITK